METALMIISSFLLLENIVLALVFFNRRSKRKSTIKRNKRMRTEFNSAMVNMRRLENLLRETAKEDKNEVD